MTTLFGISSSCSFFCPAGFSLICLPASLETLSHTLFQELQEFRKLLKQRYFQCLREHSSSSWGGQWCPAHHLGKRPLHHVWPTLKHKRVGPVCHQWISHPVPYAAWTTGHFLPLDLRKVAICCLTAIPGLIYCFISMHCLSFCLNWNYTLSKVIARNPGGSQSFNTGTLK